MSTLLWGLLAAIAAFLLPFQAGANARLGKAMPEPLLGAVLNFVVGLAALCLLAFRGGLPRAGALAGLPWWAWVGGLIGATYVGSAIYAAPRLGATSLLAAGLVGQAAGSLLVDHFGLVGFEARAASPARLAGLAIVCLGAYLVLRK